MFEIFHLIRLKWKRASGMCMSCIYVCQSSYCYLWCYTIPSSLHTNGFSVITFAYYMVSRCCMLSLNFIWVKRTRVWSTQFSLAEWWRMKKEEEKNAVVHECSNELKQIKWYCQLCQKHFPGHCYSLWPTGCAANNSSNKIVLREIETHLLFCASSRAKRFCADELERAEERWRERGRGLEIERVRWQRMKWNWARA